MPHTTRLAFAALVALGSLDAHAAPAVATQAQAARPSATTSDDLARFLDDGAGDRAALVASLRAGGQRGLDEALRAIPFDGNGVPVVNAADARERRALALADDVAQQKNAAYTGVFWFTSLDDALAAAKREHKPVLSLRLLGSLDDELSCANSRYFRSLVYPDPAVRKLLRDKFIVAWQSVRPVPKVTIDMGDGRKLVGTVTGNSAHIVLDENGNVVDAIPGLYDASRFADALNDALVLAKLRPAARAGAHKQRVAVVDAEWSRLAPGAAIPQLDNDDSDRLDGLAISPRALMKAIPERQILAKLVERRAPELSLLFLRVGAERGIPKLSKGALAIFRSQLAPGVSEQAALGTTLPTLAADAAQNEYVMHRQVHVWLANSAATTSSEMQRRLYDDLFATPDRDPWLGLVPIDGYNGIGNGGVR